jgi:hypothetical protein
VTYTFYSTCVNWPEHPGIADGLDSMIDNARTITRESFVKYIDRTELQAIEKGLGYSLNRRAGLVMADDWHVSYHRSKLHDKRVYFFKWSAIEHVFTRRANEHFPTQG